MKNIIFLKLGGSLITDKTGVEAVRKDVLFRLAVEIKQALEDYPNFQLLIGHGSGSFGHVAAAKYGTRLGVRTAEQWIGFGEVSSAASRLNGFVMAALLKAGVPAIRLQPSASALCADGKIQTLATKPVEMALEAGLVPVIFGDVAFDTVNGGTIISTEEVMAFLANDLHPTWLLLAGETEGVLDVTGQVIPSITNEDLAGIAEALGGSRGTDVTGGMVNKVQTMLDLVTVYPQLKVRILSGLTEGNLQQVVTKPDREIGTLIHSSHS